ncbi:the aldehyde dehydrogenase cp-ADH from C.plantagineum family protein [Salix suchowensis]|uniref:Aldehyde dehydrogenase n=1 Tax=Salix koriyanagi TaxID=2511006 RepID=A0A9Q0P4U5_9ROSI|nr:the aldehyde dehydrogenase cp-ADH from C.plantagineum family protein [Salix suchowensis]KAJ6681638.1 ALDEHYDE DEHYDROGENASE [Salix koriyanagi]
MATTEEGKTVFDVEAANVLSKELRDVFASGKTRSYEWRISQLKSIVKMCDEHEEDIADALRQDLSKPQLESIVYELTMVKNSCTLAIKELKHWMMPEKAKTSLTTFPSSAEIMSEPLGAVLIISAWNYPFLLSLDPLVAAIAAGNAMVLKPSELAPASSSLLAKLLPKYLDCCSIKVVEGAVSETCALLEQKWDKIFYTGNGRVGRIVMAAAAKYLTPVVLELGGKSPVVVDSDIDIQVATRRIIVGKWGCNNGQACISPDYIITTKDCAEKLVDSLKKELEAFYGKNPLESKDLSRIVNSDHYARLTNLLDEDKVSGKIVYGGERNEANLRIAPTILLGVPQNSLIMKEEIFGPLLPILTVSKIEDSFDIINSGTKPLAAYLFTNNKKLKQQFLMSVSAGGVVINDTALHLTVHSLPFGGVGESGMGSYHGKFSFDAFTHKKAVVYRSFVGDASVRYPPYTRGKLRLMRALITGNVWTILRALLGWS